MHVRPALEEEDGSFITLNSGVAVCEVSETSKQNELFGTYTAARQGALRANDAIMASASYMG